MRGNTTAINVATLRLQWSSHSSMASICSFWTISRDQLIRLRDVHRLPKRHDRTKRRKPEREPEPSRAELRASEATLDLAPRIAKRAAIVQARWSDAVRENRHWRKPQLFSVPLVQVDIEPDDDSDL
jgi:hypothetical protein